MNVLVPVIANHNGRQLCGDMSYIVFKCYKLYIAFFFWSDLPTEFSSDYLGEPTITYRYLDDNEMKVSLLCNASIFKGIEKWLNVTYRIEWFAEGKSLKSEVVCGGLPPGGQHQAPCQSVANAEVHSTLEPYKYETGQWVSL